MTKPWIAASLMLMALSFACVSAPQESEAPGTTPAVETDAEAAEVRATAEVRLKAIQAGDVDAYLSVYADDAVWMPPSAMEIVGKEAARPRIVQTFEAATLELVVQSREQTVMSPEWVANRGQYSMTVTPKQGGDSKQEVGSYLTLWRRDKEGKWKIYYDIWNTNSPIVDLSNSK